VKPQTGRPVYVLLYGAAVSAAFTAAITALHVATAGTVERNQRLLKDRALVEIFFGAEALEKLGDEEVSGKAEQLIDATTIRDPETGEEIAVYLAYGTPRAGGGQRDPRDLVGYAFPVSGIGFWAQIEGLMAVTADLKRVKGVYFLRHSETPGLGGRITDAAFRGQFVGRDVSAPLGEGQARFLHIGGSGPRGTDDPKSGRWVDGITGATGTSSAAERFINESIRRFRRAWQAADIPKPPPVRSGPARDGVE
jgi:Na+-transporting NADH:ubiquinone oxidoreductase subunit C